MALKSLKVGLSQIGYSDGVFSLLTYLLIAAGEDVAISHKTRFSEVLRFTALQCVADFYFSVVINCNKVL